MPGIQLLQKKNSNISISLKQIDNIAYTNDYRQSIIFSNDSFMIFNSSYEDYPITKFVINDIIIILEGYVYNLDMDHFINNIVKIYRNNEILNSEIITNKLEEIDGDYIIYIINSKTDELIIINDQLKRLPLYYFENNEFFICARDLKFITANIELEINNDALIDYLLFMIPSGKDTLYQNVYKLDCASILQSTKSEFKLKNYKIWNYQNQKLKKNSFERNHKEITKLLFTGMKDRISRIKGNNINVLLSGGLDSRMIIAMLNNLDKNVNAHTFLYPDKTNIDDYDDSKKIVALTEFNWNSYNVDEINEENIQEIIDLKDAMNYAGIANILSFLKKITKNNEQYYTGDGGRILKNDFPREKISNYDELINYLIAHKVVFKPKAVSEILGISLGKVFDRILMIFSAYPESDFKYKYLHFLYHERTLNWLQEGEDRNRKYFWSATPFSNQLLYDYVKNINSKYKRSFRLYKQIINNIDDRFMGISYGEIDNLSSLRYVISDRIKLLLGLVPTIKNRLKNIQRKEISYFENSDEFIKLFLSNKNQEIFKVITSRNYTKSEIFTLVSLLEYFKL